MDSITIDKSGNIYTGQLACSLIGKKAFLDLERRLLAQRDQIIKDSLCGPFRVYEIIDGSLILRAAQSSRKEAEAYMSKNRILVEIN